MPLGLRAAAGQLGISHVALLKAVRAGRVERNADGSFDIEECRKQLGTNTHPGKSSSARAQQRIKSTKETALPPSKPAAESAPRAEPEEDAEPEVELDNGSYNEACRQEKWESVKKKRLERRKREGELLEAAEVRQAWSEMISSARAALLLLPAKLAPKITMVTDTRECQVVIDREVRAVLASLSEYSTASYS